MTTTATERQHEPWCSEHVHASPEVGPVGWCTRMTHVHGLEIEVISDVDTLAGATGIEVYATPDNFLTAQQAREVAWMLLKAANFAEGHASC